MFPSTDSSTPRRARRAAAFFSFFLLAFGALAAQTPGSGALAGRVLDPAGAVVARAGVTITNDATGERRQLSTDARGGFEADLLPPGVYDVRVTAPGFPPLLARGARVVGTQTTPLRLRLALAAQTTVIGVAAAAPEGPSLGAVTGGDVIRALPLANRNFTQILSLSPGVVVEVPNAAQLGRNSQNVSDDGARTTANNFQFNGVDANNLAENSASGFDPEVGVAIPAPDTIEEFRAQTGQYDAAYGRGAGANVDVVGRSGGNNFHGAAWEFLRNDVLDANDFFLNQNGQPRPVLKQNQFGATLGGPLRRGRSFFFFGYQTTLQRDGQATGSLVSTFLPPLTNDRSPAALGRVFGGQSGVAGGAAVAADGSNINPVALALLNAKLPDGSYLIPSPQTTVTGAGGTIGESTFSSPAHYREDQFTLNLDHGFSANNRASARLFTARDATEEPFSPFGATVPGFGQNETQRNDDLVFSDTQVLGPDWVNEARAGYLRFHGLLAPQNPIAPAAIGLATPAGIPELPSLFVDGLFNLGPAGEPFYYENVNSFIWKDTLSLTSGAHSLRFGGEAKRHQLNVNVPYVTNGFLEFRSFPDFLLGESAAQNGSSQSNIFDSSGASGLFRKDERYTDFAAFLQDDYHASPRLTLNAGLRYEYFGPPSEQNGRLSNFDPSQAPAVPPASGSLAGFLLPANFSGALPAGVARTSGAGYWNPDYTDFSPRLGLSWRPARAASFVVRAGYGIYYQRLSGELALQNGGQPPFAVTQLLQGVENAAATFQQPYSPPLPPNSAYPIFPPRTPESAISLAAIARTMKSPYTQSYSLDLEGGSADAWRWSAAYVGSHTNRLTVCTQFNQALLASPANPVNGQTTTTVENIAQRVPFVGVATGSFDCGTSLGANSNYNSLQTSLLRALGGGLRLQTSYTYSKALDSISGTGGLSSLDLNFLGDDQTQPKLSYGPDNFDRTHRLVMDFVLSPRPPAPAPAALRAALAHWRFSGIAVLQSGAPITVIDSSAASVYGDFGFTSHAQCTGLAPASNGPLESRLNQFFNPAAFAPPPVIGDGTGFGNCGVGILRGPSQENLDAAAERDFALGEGRALRLRAEAYNLTNTPKFGPPANDRSLGPGFGVISSTAANPRLLQLALKLTF